MNHTPTSLPRVLLGLSLVLGLTPWVFATSKTTLMLPLADEPGWRDMAFLAAVPAAGVANPSGASLIAWDPTAAIGPETQDYLQRYAPDSV